MPVCEVCGNDYDKTIEVSASGETHTFDSFECAIHALAPHCAHCDCRIVGHGVEVGRRHVLLCSLRGCRGRVRGRRSSMRCLHLPSRVLVCALAGDLRIIGLQRSD